MGNPLETFAALNYAFVGAAVELDVLAGHETGLRAAEKGAAIAEFFRKDRRSSGDTLFGSNAATCCQRLDRRSRLESTDVGAIDFFLPN
jgi:hypothetical protein